MQIKNTNWWLVARFRRSGSITFVHSSSKKMYRALGEAVRAERKKARLSQEKLAEKADLTRNYIGDIERAEKKVTLEALAKIARALRCRVRDLLWDV
jgi:DNA-binding XRE family transcriptional regulator